MSNILVPVDFSLACHNAYRFALHLAEELRLNVVLAHYYTGSLVPSFSGERSLRNGYIDRLRQFAYSSTEGIDYALVEPPCGVKVAYEARVSLRPAAAIVKRAEQDDISLVIMAPRSSPALLGKWLGSTATTVSESCDRPVYLVPEGARYRPFHRMVVANNYTVATPYPLWQLKELAGNFDSEVHFVHVEQVRRGLPVNFVPWKLMEQIVDQGEDEYALSFRVVTVADTDVARGLMDYADNVAADLLVIVNRTRRRWRTMLRATLTHNLALRTRLPVLVLHHASFLAPRAATDSISESTAV